MVAAVRFPGQVRGIVLIAYHGVEINHPVEPAACPDIRPLGRYESGLVARRVSDRIP